MSRASYQLLAQHQDDRLVAFGAGGERTAATLRADVARVASQLPPARTDEHLVVLCRDRYHFSVSVLAAWATQRAVALPPNNRPEIVEEVRQRSGAVAILHDTEHTSDFDIRPWLDTTAAPPLSTSPTLLASRHVATVFTSGSTGQPQACPKTAGQLCGETRMLLDTWSIPRGHRLVATVPPHHLYGFLFSVLIPLQGGGAFLRDTPLHAEAVAARIEGYRADVLVSVPAHLRSFELIEPPRLGQLKHIFSSTAPLPATTAEALRAHHGLEVMEVYGSSETGGLAYRSQIKDPTWTAFPPVAVSRDPAGCLLARSPFAPSGTDEPYQTADRVEMVGENRFRLLGRADDIVKVGGKRISLRDMENRLLSLTGVVDAAVCSRPTDDARHTEILAAVVAPDGSVPQLRQQLLRWFEASTLPRRIRLMAELPREENGKVTRDRLLELFQTKTERSTFDVIDRETTATAAGLVFVTRLHVPPDSIFFRGHFPGFPILPGIVQLHEIVLPEIHRVAPQLRHLQRISRLKFVQPIRPGEDLVLRITVTPETHRARFRLFRAEDNIVASGQLEFRPTEA